MVPKLSLQNEDDKNLPPDNSQQLEKVEKIKKQCFFCQQEREKFFRCGKCKIALYCNKTCQKSDWKKHEKFCALLKKNFSEKQHFYPLGNQKISLDLQSTENTKPLFFAEPKGNQSNTIQLTTLNRSDSAISHLPFFKIKNGSFLFPSFCSYCQKTVKVGEKKLLVCGKCRTAYYCGKDCQKKDFERHKIHCFEKNYLKKITNGNEEHIALFQQISVFFFPTNSEAMIVAKEFKDAHLQEISLEAIKRNFLPNILTLIIKKNFWQVIDFSEKNHEKVTLKTLTGLLKNKQYVGFAMHFYAEKDLKKRIRLLKMLISEKFPIYFNVQDQIFRKTPVSLEEKRIWNRNMNLVCKKKKSALPVYSFVFLLLGFDLIDSELSNFGDLSKNTMDYFVSIGNMFEGFKWIFLGSIFLKMQENCFSLPYDYFLVDGKETKIHLLNKMRPSLVFLNSTAQSLDFLLFSTESTLSTMAQGMMFQLRQELEKIKNNVHLLADPSWLSQGTYNPLKRKNQWSDSRREKVNELIEVLEKNNIDYKPNILSTTDSQLAEKKENDFTIIK